ncbi:phage portal protein, partial [Stenotrophomonas maltophilia]
VDSVVGLNFKLQYMPNAELLGVSEEEALEYADMVENMWDVAANSSLFHLDAQRMQTFSGLMRTAYAGYYIDGEVLATI